MNDTVFIVYFLSLAEIEVQDMHVFISREKANSYALKLGGQIVGKQFSSLSEMELWYNLDDGLERPGYVKIVEKTIAS